MKHVVFAWELGGGTGHLHNFALISQQLLKQGYRVSWIVRDVVGARRLLSDAAIELLPAPIFQGGKSRLPSAVSFNEVLLRVGYQHPQDLMALAESWKVLLTVTAPDLLIAEHAPTALIAARSLSLKTLVLGSGFTLPPQQSPLPSLEPWHELPAKRLIDAENRLLQVVNQVLEHLKGKGLTSMAELFYQFDHFLMTYPQIDHYPVRKNIQYWGVHVAQTDTLPEPQWPTGKDEKIFVYLTSHSRFFSELMEQLSQMQNPVLVVSLDISDQTLARFSIGHLRIIRHQVDMTAVCQQANIIINHASQGLLATVLKQGQPLIMLPGNVEQAGAAWRVHHLKLGSILPLSRQKPNFSALINDHSHNKTLYKNAAEFARRQKKSKMTAQALVNAILEKVDAALK